MHPFSTPWKRQKTFRFFWRFQGIGKGALGTNGLIIVSKFTFFKVLRNDFHPAFC